MKSTITERQELPSHPIKIESDEDRELRETLLRLEVWKKENLMVPNGMDRFADDIRKSRAISNK